MKKPLVLFSHGKESGPWGKKIQYLAGIAENHGCNVLSPDYRDLANPEDRIQRLLALDFPLRSKVVLVGSSMGGYVSVIASETLKPHGLFLMAPALYVPGYQNQNPASGAKSTCVVLGWKDEVIPVNNGIRFAQAECASLHILDTDHRLNSVLPELGGIFSLYLESICGSV